MNERSIFIAALEKGNPVERAAYLAEACAGEPELRQRVDKLLQTHEQVDGILDRPAVELPATIGYRPITEGPGTVIGRYKLLQQIGEGGFGAVYMAEQKEPIHRRVALKIIKLGMDTREVIARFEAERQALALMDHPNIAKVLDAGATETGRPYFVMELVKGVSISEFSDKNQLPARDRLELFTAVCQAVQHAHQKGVIHRDLKPSNILVTLHDGKPVPKVIDFGVAKALNQELTEKTLFTAYGHMVGTPQYMSPEQAEMSGLDVDTRSDIYSLGVLLYELLTGTTPLEAKRLRSASYAEMQRIIREEEPPRPSHRLSTLGEQLTVIARDRHSDPVRLRQILRGELDWIVMKALEKERSRRYETADGLARDVQRYLANEPVEACPPSAGYRLRKFARKYRTLLRVAGAFVLLLVLAAAVSTWQAVRASLAKQQALKERDRAEASFRMARDAVDRFFTQVSQSPKLKAHAMEKFRKDLLQNAKEFYDRFIQEQFDAPGVRYDVGLAYHRLAEIDRQLGEYAAAEESSTKAIAVLEELAGGQPDVAEYQRDLAGSYAALGRVCSETANREKADTAFQQALAIQEKQAAAHPQAPEYLFAQAKTYFELAQVRRGDHHESSLMLCQQSQDILSKLLRDYPRVSEYQVLLAEAQMNLGNLYNVKGEHEKQAYLAKGWHEKAATALKEAQSIYARLVQDQPEISPEHLESLAHSHALLGIAYRRLTQTEKMEAELRQALRIYEKLASEHPDVLEYAFDVGRCHNELAAAANRAGRAEVELEEYAKAIAIMEDLVGKGKLDARRQLLVAQTCRAAVLARQGEHARATEQADAIVRQGGLLPVEVYNVACVFSLASAAVDRDSKLSPADRNRLKARYADRAMDFLGQAVAKGFPYLRDLKEDHDLDPLRAREDFRKLLAD